MKYEGLIDKLSKGESKKILFYVSVVPVDPIGRVLIGERKEDGIFTTPGGGANPGETPEQAAVRECFEEAGLTIQPMQLESLGVKAAPNGKPVHCFIYRATPFENTTTRLDPDKEVSEWIWYSKENLPEGLSRQRNQNRLETITQALMKFYSMTKSDLEITTLTEKLNKGGAGSGVKGHKTIRDRQMGHRYKVISEDKTHYHAEDHRGEKVSINRTQADEEKTEPQKMKDRRHGIEHKEDKRTEAQKMADRRRGGASFNRDWGKSEEETLDLTDKLNKGGEGSGVKGHMTARQPSALHPVVNAEPAKPINKLNAHLTSLEHGKVIPGMQTQSGKPVVNDMDTARAQGYDVQDHIDALNAHHKLAMKTHQVIEKFKMAGHKIPPDGLKIAKFHEKKMREHMKARDYLENRAKHTAEAIKEKKKEIVGSVKKSVTQMGSGLGDRDLDIGSFAQAHSKAHKDWLEKLYNGMQNYGFGDTPRSFDTEKGTLHLSKVDDGLYSGYFTNKEMGLEDNAKVRIERITIPELVQFMTAKEWISPIFDGEIQPTQNMQKDGEIAPAGLSLSESMETPIPEQSPVLDSLNSKLIQEPVQAPHPLEYRVRMLELLTKLMS